MHRNTWGMSSLQKESNLCDRSHTQVNDFTDAAVNRTALNQMMNKAILDVDQIAKQFLTLRWIINSKTDKLKYNPLTFLCNLSKTTRLKRNMTKAETETFSDVSQARCGRTEERRQQMHHGECIYPPTTTKWRDQYFHQFLATAPKSSDKWEWDHSPFSASH